MVWVPMVRVPLLVRLTTVSVSPVRARPTPPISRVSAPDRIEPVGSAQVSGVVGQPAVRSRSRNVAAAESGCRVVPC
jgi:hypothetical protein